MPDALDFQRRGGSDEFDRRPTSDPL